MSEKDLEKQIVELEATVKQLKNDQDSLSETITIMAETQATLAGLIKKQSNDYTAPIVAVVTIGAIIWMLSYYGNLMSQLSGVEVYENSNIENLELE